MPEPSTIVARFSFSKLQTDVTETLISINDVCISPLCCVPSISVLLFSTRKIFGDVKRKKEKKKLAEKNRNKKKYSSILKRSGISKRITSRSCKVFRKPV